MDVIALHPDGSGLERGRHPDRERRLDIEVSDLETRPVRPQPLGGAGADEVGLADDTDDASRVPTTGSPLMSYSSIILAASVSDADVAMTIGWSAIRSPTVDGRSMDVSLAS
jgi:hypothetical protein